MTIAHHHERIIMNEFEAIQRYFAPLSHEGSRFLIGDDAALLKHRINTASCDAMIQDVHFRADEKPDDLARKLLRINLSDFAAMGAVPHYYLLTLSLTKDVFQGDWLEAFAHGLAQDQKHYNVCLAGGDLTRSDQLMLSLNLLGEVKPQDSPLTRKGARDGDWLCVSGWLGQAALYRRIRDAAITTDPESIAILKQSYCLPPPRLSLSRHLHGLARAVIDISDGLTGDLAHLCQNELGGLGVGERGKIGGTEEKVGKAGGLRGGERGKIGKAEGKIGETGGKAGEPRGLEGLAGLRGGLDLGAKIHTGDLPLSPASLSCGRDEALRAALCGGEDYELLFACPPEYRDRLDSLSRRENIPLTVIGQFTNSGHIDILDEKGHSLREDFSSWSHF